MPGTEQVLRFQQAGTLTISGFEETKPPPWPEHQREPTPLALQGCTFSAFAKFFSLLWSEASSLTLCKHDFVWLKMYFKNVTNYPLACNRSFRVCHVNT